MVGIMASKTGSLSFSFMFGAEINAMKFTLLFILTAISSLLSAQCDGNRYLNFIFSDTYSTIDVQYGTNINYQGAN